MQALLYGVARRTAAADASLRRGEWKRDAFTGLELRVGEDRIQLMRSMGDVAGFSAAIRVLAPQSELLDLLIAADALVTVESLSAVEALVVGRPVVILDMPTHLSALVDAGVALGVAGGEDPTDTLRRALFDAETRNALQHARALYLDELALGVDGQATARIVDLLRDTAARGSSALPAGPDRHGRV